MPMPCEPPSNVWDFPDPLFAPNDIVGVGADLEPGTLLAAYRQGIFPMPVNNDLMWWSPDPRGILPLDSLRVTDSLRRSCKRFEVRVDTEFEEVMRLCADPSRPGGWITADISAAYRALFDLGWAHSIEAWREGELVGGLYGVAIGGLFAGESMFHRVRDASKVALVGLVDILLSDSDEKPLVDVQWCTEHLRSLGAIEIPRREYQRLLHQALLLPLPFPLRRENARDPR